MNRQYIGARYVPKFFGENNGVWLENREYEALTIVQYMNNSYTSKKPVPANVGNPIENGEYWVCTGNYNAQVEAYRTELANYKISNNARVEAYGTELANYKISNNARIDKLEVYVTPEMYGAKGNGITDDTQALQDAINSGKTVIVKNGIYKITNTITSENGIKLLLDDNAVIKLDNTVNCMFDLTHNYVPYMWHSFIIGGTLDGNYKCNTIIGLNCYRRFTLERVRITNFKVEGINTRYNDSNHTVYDGAELSAKNLMIINEVTGGIFPNEVVPTNTIGVNDSGSDNVFEDIIVQNTYVGFKCGNSNFSNCKLWLSTQSIFNGSVAFEIYGNALITNCTSDTVQKAIKLDGLNHGIISNFTMYTNANVTPASFANSHGFTFLDAPVGCYCEMSNIVISFDGNTFTNLKFSSDTIYTANRFENCNFINVVHPPMLNVPPLNPTLGRGTYRGNSLDVLHSMNANYFVSKDFTSGMPASYGFLEVIQCDKSLTMQRFTDTLNNEMHIRFYDGTKWTTWS